jgi:hypothetical protein
MQATIRIKYVNQPREGKKMGSIKGDDGTIIGVYPDKLNLFQQGQTYTVEYDEGEGGFKRLKRIVPGAPSTLANDNSHDKGADIFVTGVIGRCFQGTGNLPPYAEVRDMVQRLRLAWAEGMKDGPADAVPEDKGAPF